MGSNGNDKKISGSGSGNTGSSGKDKTRNKSSGHTSSGSRNHKPKRAKIPHKFNEWAPEDREKYDKTIINLRRWKAMQRQCYYIRRRVDQWINFKSIFSFSPIYKEELKRYEQAKKEFKPIQDNESLDLPPFQG